MIRFGYVTARCPLCDMQIELSVHETQKVNHHGKVKVYLVADADPMREHTVGHMGF